MRSVGSVVLAGVQRRSVVQMVDLGKRPGSMRVPVHRRRDSVHPTVMGQLIVLGMKSEQKSAGCPVTFLDKCATYRKACRLILSIRDGETKKLSWFENAQQPRQKSVIY